MKAPTVVQPSKRLEKLRAAKKPEPISADRMVKPKRRLTDPQSVWLVILLVVMAILGFYFLGHP